jgi:transcriptional regulator with XRE-family HTH domain
MTTQDPGWPQWMREFGRQQRRIRELLGLSQEQVARLAGVSQGAVSRFESGRGLATPLLVVLKINIAIAREIRKLDAGRVAVNDELRRALDIQDALSPPVGDIGFHALPVSRDANLDELIRLYQGVPEKRRSQLVAIMRAAVDALAA